MRLNNGTISFNLNISGGGGTPSWGTELGQNQNYNYSVPGVEKLITSMLYCKIDEKDVFCPLGKGGNQQDNYTYELASLYKKVYVNEKLIPGASFILLIVKRIAGDYHVGRRTLKYSSKMKYKDEYVNEECFKKIVSTLKLSDKSAWFIHSISTKNQDELHFEAIVANKEKSLDFNDSDERKKYMQELIEKDGILDEDDFDKNRAENGFNKIYYGVPGCGKSYTVDKIFNESEYVVFRTTFHPEYTNSDFVGQIIPVVKDSKVEYSFHPGAFSLALKYALENREQKVCLIIEEINRGNASAIFGDIFQLLDREDKGKSKYKIYNGPIIDYLNDNEIYLEKIYIPSNLWIIATMNTSDQNVFTLDTAFKRRWKMEYIPNVFETDDDYSKLLREAKIPRTEITWEQFITEVNNKIADADNTINSEDKQLGMYFVTLEEVQNEKEFAEKILSYLWDDVAKINPEDWFGNIKTYDKLLSAYEKSSVKVFNELFKNYQIHIEENSDEQSDESNTI